MVPHICLGQRYVKGCKGIFFWGIHHTVEESLLFSMFGSVANPMLVTMCSVSKAHRLGKRHRKANHNMKIFIDSIYLEMLRLLGTMFSAPPHQENHHLNCGPFLRVMVALKKHTPVFVPIWPLGNFVVSKKPFQPEVIGTSIREQFVRNMQTVVALLHLGFFKLNRARWVHKVLPKKLFNYSVEAVKLGDIYPRCKNPHQVGPWFPMARHDSFPVHSA